MTPMIRLSFSGLHHKAKALAVFFLLVSFAMAAQNKPCDPVVKANRKKKLVITEAYKLESLSLSFHDKDVLIHYGNSYETVFLQKNKLMLAVFHTRQGEIIDQEYAENDINGNLVMVDSIDHVKGKHSKHYLNYLYTSTHVVLSKRYYPGNRLASAVYYSLLNGRDSVIKEWYTNGLLKSLRFKHMVPVDSVDLIERSFRNNDLRASINWPDSVSFAWDSTGILRRSSNPATTHSYYANGVLKSQNLRIAPWPSYQYNPEAILEMRSRDTVLKGVLCRYQTTFYPTGILQSEEFICGDTPCYTSTFYSPEGTLKKRIYKGPLLGSGIQLGVHVPRATMEFFGTAPIVASPRSGHLRYLISAFTDVLCQNEGVMEGTYLLKFQVSETGKASFISFDGKGSGNLAVLFSDVFNRMEPWYPTRFDKFCNSVFTMELTIKTTD